MNQNIDYDIPLSPGLLDPQTFLSGLCVLGMIVWGIWMAIKRPIIGFGILWFFLTISVTSSVFPLRDLMFEHHLYLPSFGFFLVFCASIFSLIKSKRTSALFLSVLVLAASFLTYQRNFVWNNVELLWQDTIRKSPEKARPHANLALFYQRGKKYQKAVDYYLKALQLKMIGPNDRAHILMNLGAVYAEAGDHEKAAFCFSQALAINRNIKGAYKNLTFAYAALGEFDKAETYGKIAAPLYPEIIGNLYNLGTEGMLHREYEDAAKIFKLILALDPQNQDARRDLLKIESLR